MLKPAHTDIDPDAKSHAGWYDGFAIRWVKSHWWWVKSGWYVIIDEKLTGPFHTSQAAFGAAKDAIDQLIAEGK